MNTLQNQYDFKNYLLGLKKSGYFQDDLIFWRNRIPLPLDLIYRLYNDRDILITKYIDHLLAIIIYNDIYSKYKLEYDINELPDEKYLLKIEKELFKNIQSEVFSKKNYLRIQEHITELLYIDYDFNPMNIINALSHRGKKYSRIYIHSDIKKLIGNQYPILLSKVGIGNNDMFGNVVCDHFKIYRGGLSDAFAAIFNDLIKFIIEFKESNVSGKSKVEFEVNSSDVSDENLVEFVDTLGGKIYEPIYINGKIGVRINQSHIFINSLTLTEVQKIIPFLISLSEDEYNSYSDQRSKILESFRENISRSTRLKLER